ncbi:phosphate/phosphite/phosphonate ABC transporter substrate-binding protein [Frankia sp. CiP3]|uniref:phosphate/phosphite/phosphonate ABC transporter substrate-binding protein n=1 Tax=Frankia sp. CiP3 TaxID=2880971 RepID=UPI0021053325|nr:phosphate/phosphite/phosphonate ABC transporter substrate-binding protein [Frankia sp. CiP3]
MFINRSRIAILSASVVLVMLTMACGRSQPTAAPPDSTSPLVFVAVPNQGSTSLRETFQPILLMLQKETGRPVLFQTATNYQAVIDGLKEGKIQVANLGPFSYVIAKDNGVPITVAAAQVTARGAPPGYRSYGITNSGSSIQSLGDFRGKKICFVDRDSTSGYLYPIWGLSQVGIDPEKDILADFVGAHDASVLAVANGTCNAGFAYDTMVDRQLIERGQLAPGAIRVVWKSPVIPGAPLVVSNMVPPELRTTLISSLQTKATEEYLRAHGFCSSRCGITSGAAYGYVPVSDQLYDSVREVCRTTKAKACSSGG